MFFLSGNPLSEIRQDPKVKFAYLQGRIAFSKLPNVNKKRDPLMKSTD